MHPLGKSERVLRRKKKRLLKKKRSKRPSKRSIRVRFAKLLKHLKRSKARKKQRDSIKPQAGFTKNGVPRYKEDS